MANGEINKQELLDWMERSIKRLESDGLPNNIPDTIEVKYLTRGYLKCLYDVKVVIEEGKFDKK